MCFSSYSHTARAPNLRHDLITASVSCVILKQSDWSIMTSQSEEQSVNIKKTWQHLFCGIWHQFYQRSISRVYYERQYESLFVRKLQGCKEMIWSTWKKWGPSKVKWTRFSDLPCPFTSMVKLWNLCNHTVRCPWYISCPLSSNIGGVWNSISNVIRQIKL